MNSAWDDNEFPLGYLITIRTYGTWLHGDDRKSVDRHGKNIYSTKRIEANPDLERQMGSNCAGDLFLLDGPQRSVVESAIRGVCVVRNYGLCAINVRTNHAHIVVSAPIMPEPIIIAFKSNATRELRTAGLISTGQKVWSRGGSRRYLWRPNQMQGAVDYVICGQGDDLPMF